MDTLDGVRYIRFSTDNQDAESQRFLCHKLEKENKFNLHINIIKEIVDEGLSGTDPTRPGLLELQEWV
jgi:DNA invertase Pin-like site-specific DNA recombinase